MINRQNIATIQQMLNAAHTYPLFGIEYLEVDMAGKCIISYY